MKILFLALSALLFLGCSDNKKQEHTKVTQTEVKAVVSKEKIPKEVIQEKVVKEESVEEKAPEIAVAPKKAIEVKEVKTEVVPKEVAVIQAPSIDGTLVFKKCVACHGANAEKKALNKSQVIQGWKAEKIITALHGYKDGTYGGAMKGVMKSQVSNLSDDEIKAVAAHISKL